jgi:hypothetical protein
MSLVGKFAFRYAGESYQSGEVMASVAPDVYLIKLDYHGDCRGDGISMPMQVVCVQEMVAADPMKTRFFDTRAELDAWLKFVDDLTLPDPSTKVMKFERR